MSKTFPSISVRVMGVFVCVSVYRLSMYILLMVQDPLHRFSEQITNISSSELFSEEPYIMICQCFRSSPISVIIWFLAISSFTRSRHLSFGLPRFRFPSTVICNIFLVASSLSRLCTCPNHLNLFSLRNSAFGYMCVSFQMSTFLTWSTLVFPLAHRNMRISVACNFLSFFLTAQHSAPYTMASFIAVLYTLSLNFVGMFLSHITPVVSLHFDQTIFTLLFTYFSAHPLASNNTHVRKIYIFFIYKLFCSCSVNDQRFIHVASDLIRNCFDVL